MGSGCTSGEDFSMSHWRVSVKEVNITLSCKGLISASLHLCPGVSGEAGTRLSAQPTPAPWQLAEVQKHAGVHGHSTQLMCAEGQDVHLARPEMAPEGLRHISTPLTVLLFRHDAKEAKYHQG